MSRSIRSFVAALAFASGFAALAQPLPTAELDRLSAKAASPGGVRVIIGMEVASEPEGRLSRPRARMQREQFRAAREAAMAEDNGDVQRLDTLDAALRKRLAKPAASDGPLDWAADQIGLAHVALARERLTGSKPAAIGMMLVEAAATARELGVGVLAARADRLAA